jgi:hydrogenase maturation protease
MKPLPEDPRPASGPTLVVGIGNPDRGDDGVAGRILGRLCEQLGRPAPAEEESGAVALGPRAFIRICRQLLPEQAIEDGRFDRLILVDAHVFAERRRLLFTRVRTPERRPSLTGHALLPEDFLELVGILTGRTPAGFLLSVRGHRFDPGRGLSPQTAALVNPAVRLLRRLVAVSHPEPRRPAFAFAPDGMHFED